MNDLIYEVYSDTGLPNILIKKKVEDFSRHSDIEAEFCEWIKTNQFKDVSCVTVEGYSAKKLADLSEYLDGEGAYAMLIQLRDNPEDALKKINTGFKMK